MKSCSTRPPRFRLPVRAAGLALAAALALPAAARCIDEENVEQRSGVNTNGAPISPTAARANLQTMVRDALARSQSIGAQRLLAEAAAIDISEAKSARFPQVAANGFLGNTQSTVGGIDETSGRQGRLGANVSALVWDGGRTSALVDWRANLAEAARQGQLSAQEQVALQTVSLAIERARYRLQVQVYQQYARKMSCLVEALDTIVRADKGRSSELVQAQKSLQQAELAQTQTISMVRQIETRLRRFVGDGLPPSDGLTPMLLTPPPLLETQAQIESAPEIAQLQAQADAADSYASSISKSRWPQVSLIAGNTMVRGAGNSSGWQAGASVSVPLFNPSTGYATSSAIKRAEATRMQREDAIEARRFRTAEVHEQATAAFERARRVIDVLRDSDRVRTYTLQQWQQLGRRSLFDVMSSESEHYNLRVSYVNALFDGQQSTALLWSLGSGILGRLQ